MSAMFQATVDNESDLSRETVEEMLAQEGLDSMVTFWLGRGRNIVVESDDLNVLAEAVLVLYQDDARAAFYSLANTTVRD